MCRLLNRVHRRCGSSGDHELLGIQLLKTGVHLAPHVVAIRDLDHPPLPIDCVVGRRVLFLPLNEHDCENEREKAAYASVVSHRGKIILAQNSPRFSPQSVLTALKSISHLSFRILCSLVRVGACGAESRKQDKKSAKSNTQRQPNARRLMISTHALDPIPLGFQFPVELILTAELLLERLALDFHLILREDEVGRWTETADETTDVVFLILGELRSLPRLVGVLSSSASRSRPSVGSGSSGGTR